MLLDIFDPKAPPQAIGIDLGTTNSIVAHVRDGRPVPLTTCDGSALLPSVVHYGAEGSVLVGRNAAKLVLVGPIALTQPQSARHRLPIERARRSMPVRDHWRSSGTIGRSGSVIIDAENLAAVRREALGSRLIGSPGERHVKLAIGPELDSRRSLRQFWYHILEKDR